MVAAAEKEQKDGKLIRGAQAGAVGLTAGAAAGTGLTIAADWAGGKYNDFTRNVTSGGLGVSTQTVDVSSIPVVDTPFVDIPVVDSMKSLVHKPGFRNEYPSEYAPKGFFGGLKDKFDGQGLPVKIAICATAALIALAAGKMTYDKLNPSDVDPNKDKVANTSRGTQHGAARTT